MFLRKVIGIHSCKEALKARSSTELKKIYFKAEWQNNSALVELAGLAKEKQLIPEIMSLKKMNQIGKFHQGVCVLVSGQPQFNVGSADKNSVVLVLDRVQDPRNFGAIIRTAWLMGVDCIFSSSRRSAVLSSFVMKAAGGGVEYVPVELRNNLSQCLKELKENQFSIYALDFHSENLFWKEKFEGRVAFLLGGEQSGLRKGLKKFCDKVLFIHQKQKSASYNVSVVAGIVLWESFRQRSFNV